MFNSKFSIGDKVKVISEDKLNEKGTVKAIEFSKNKVIVVMERSNKGPLRFNENELSKC